jgi:hypothetical protein
MELEFKRYERRSRPIGTDPVVGIQRRGTISFNAAAFSLLGGQKGKDLYVELLFDEEHQVVGIRSVEPGGRHSYPVRKQPRAESFLVTGKGFLAYNNVPIGEARQYRAKDLGNGIIGFSLKDDLME